jgi:hypothetical protein
VRSLCQLGRNNPPQRGDGRLAVGQNDGGRRRSSGPRVGGKKVRATKRRLLVATEGSVLNAKVHSGKILDQDGIKLVLEAALERLPRLSRLWVDAALTGVGVRNGLKRS